MIDDYVRSPPLRKCPNLACNRGRKVCRKLAFGVACLKTHFANHDEFADDLTRMIQAFRKKHPSRRDPNAPRLSDSEAGARMRRALEARLAQCEAEEAAIKSKVR